MGSRSTSWVTTFPISASPLHLSRLQRSKPCIRGSKCRATRAAVPDGSLARDPKSTLDFEPCEGRLCGSRDCGKPPAMTVELESSNG
ncbi:hypothetical protein CDL15_Pgr014516 [Punica granatum]|uniref:Uncharacterized protein n=1 Tax=Punica granatum TaxID=22663 RepID=A0A218WE76_PUNGR|nr:hypothetical protein CDL15_Pgr014516 [Punica granatum]PKI69695.1 hypothetical protein CRG98_009851 [Punica granatum]